MRRGTEAVRYVHRSPARLESFRLRQNGSWTRKVQHPQNNSATSFHANLETSTRFETPELGTADIETVEAVIAEAEDVVDALEGEDGEAPSSGWEKALSLILEVLSGLGGGGQLEVYTLDETVDWDGTRPGPVRDFTDDYLPRMLDYEATDEVLARDSVYGSRQEI